VGASSYGTSPHDYKLNVWPVRRRTMVSMLTRE